MGPIFHEKIPNYGSNFQNFPGARYANPKNFEKIAKNGYLFSEKTLKMGTFFGKITPEHGYGSRAASGTSPTIPNLSTPPGFIPGL